MLCGLAAVVGISFKLWYNYPSGKLSFFMSGDGAPQVEISYRDVSGAKYTDYVFPQLTHKPQLIEKTLQAAKVRNLRLKISKYSGTLNLADVFLSGEHLTDVQIEPSEGLNVLNSSANNVSAILQNETSYKICKKCYTPALKKVFWPWRLGCIIGLYLLLCAGLWGVYLRRDTIKAKFMNIYAIKNYALILPYAKPYWFRALLAVLITAPVGMMDAVIAWSLKPFMDVVLVEKQTGWTMYIPLLIIIFSILQALFTYVATYMNTWVGNKMAMDLKKQLFDKLMHSDAAYFDKTNSGDVLFTYNNCADSACSGLLNNLKMFSTRLFSSLSLLAVLFYNSWQLAIIASLVMFGAFLPLTKARKRLRSIFTIDMNVMAELLNRYNETFAGNRIISAYNLQQYCKQKFVYVVNVIFSLSLRMVLKLGILTPLMHIISACGIALVIWYGSYLIVSHQITVGNFASFITSLVMLYNPIKSIGNNFNSMLMSLMMIEQVMGTLKSEPRIKNAENAQKLSECHGQICYKDVSFEYIAGKPVLKNINLDIQSGQTVALVGNSGGGKTTISALLPRFYDVSGGEITLDGINIKNLDLNSLREQIAVVFQDNFLFGGTIRENIVFGRQEVTPEQLQQAVKSACLEEFIASLPDGLDTVVGERGVTLSGGQKQRVAIARAFIKNAPILILDEATSALDNKSEAIVQQAIDNLMKSRTVLVIAHRLSTVRNADKIVVINNGEIAEIGTHDELIAKNGAYAALYKTQLV
jgi:subfamily B ATP-binding cassette protein MsbA